jgi:dTDP-4-dehydrorhamnose reductase
MLHLAATRDVVRVIDDQHGAPTAASDLARAILDILTSPAAREAAGLYHITAAGETTWHGFADAIVAGWARRGHRVPKLAATTTAEYPLPARRPVNSRLDCSKIERTFGVRLPHWEASLDACLDQIAASEMEAQPC